MTDIEITRKENESAYDYHKRLVYGKLVDKTLSDVDYTELAELAYGQTYSSDVARRMFYGSRKTLEIIDAELKSTLDINTQLELDSKVLEMQKESQKYQDQRREYKKLVSIEARQEHLYDVLAAAAGDLAKSVGMIFDNKIPNSVKESSTDAVLVINDWHYGMITDNIFNIYNKEICKERVQNVIERVKKRLKVHGCNRLHVFVVGDLYHGAIHTSARVASEELVCDQLMQVSEILAQAILDLSLYVNEIMVYTTYGNHARTIQEKNSSIHRDNMERIIPWWLEQRIAAEESRIGCSLNITIMPDSGTEFIVANVCGHDICACHGDLDSVKTSPRILATLFHKKYGKNIEYILIGDKHHRESFEELGVSAMISGSLCGTDNYANDKRLYSVPSQLLLIVDAENGVDAEYHIKC